MENIKIIIFNKIQQAISKKKDIYYIPDFDNEFSIEKLLNLKKILGENDFNVLIAFVSQLRLSVQFVFLLQERKAVSVKIE